MENIRAHILIKIMSATLIMAFITLDISWAYPPEDHNNTVQSSSNLAAQSGFQQKAIIRDGQNFTMEFYSKAIFLYSIYHMADYFFESPERDMASYAQHLETVMARELGEKATEGIGLSKVRFIDSKEADCYKNNGNENSEGRVVLIPYKKGDTEYIIQVAMKKDPVSRNLLGRNIIKPDDKLFNDKYAVKIVHRGYKGIGVYGEEGKGGTPAVSAPIPAPVVPEKQNEAAQDIPPTQDSGPIITAIIFIAAVALGSAGAVSGIHWLHPYLAAAGIDIHRTVSVLSCGMPLLFTGIVWVNDAKGTKENLYLKEKLTDILQNSLGYPKTKILDDIVNGFEKLFRDKDMDFADIKKGLISNNPSELFYSVDCLIDWLDERGYFDINRPNSLLKLLISGLDDSNEDIFKTKGYSATDSVRRILESQLIYILLSLADVKVRAYFSKKGPLILVHLNRYSFMFIDRANKVSRRIDISEYYEKEADGSLILKESERFSKKDLASVEQEIQKGKDITYLEDWELLNLLYPEIQEVNIRGGALFGFKPAILYKLGEIYRLLHEDEKEKSDEKAYNLLFKSIGLTPCKFCKRSASMGIAAIFHKRYKESGDERDIKKAFAVLESVVGEDPENILAYISLGAFSLSAGNFEDAVEFCKNAILLNPDNSYAHFVQGLAFYGLNDFDNARSSFNTSIKLDPKNPAAYLPLGSTYLALKRPHVADGLFKKYMELRGHDSVSHLNVGLTLCEKGDRNKGIKQLRIAVKLVPELLKFVPNNLKDEVKEIGEKGFILLEFSLALVVFMAAMAGTSALVHHASAIWAYLHGIFSAGSSAGAPAFFTAGMLWFGDYRGSSESPDEPNAIKADRDALTTIGERLTPAQKEEVKPVKKIAPAQTQGADPAIEERVRRLFETTTGQGANNRRTLFVDKANALAALAGGGKIDRNDATSKIKYQIADLIKIIRDTPDTAISAKNTIEYLENNPDLLEADSIASSLLELVRRTPKESGQRRLIALCPDWIPGYVREEGLPQQRTLITSLITEIKPLMNRLNIEFIVENNSDRLEETVLNTGIDTANVLVIASQKKVISLRGIDKSTGASIDKLKGAFLVGIDSQELGSPYDNGKYSSELPDINLLELLSIALEAALGKEPQGKTPTIQSYDYDKGLNRIVLHLERPKIKNCIELDKINNSRKIAMRNA